MSGQTAQEVRKPGQFHSKQQSLLLVNRDGILRGALAQALEHVGFVVCQAGSGTEAVQIARNVWFDFVFVDIDSADPEYAKTVGVLEDEFPELKIVLGSGRIERTARKIAGLIWSGNAPDGFLDAFITTELGLWAA